MKNNDVAWFYVAATALGLVVLLNAAAYADPYVEACGSATFSPNRSNGNPIEFGSEPGLAACATGGYALDLGDGVAVAAEISARYDRKALHGQNGGPLNLSADGHTLHMTTVTAGPALEVDLPVDGLRWYLRAGAGVTYAAGLGDNDMSPAGQAGTGLRYDVLDNLSALAGYSVLHASGVTLQNGFGTHSDDITLHGPTLGLRWEFN